MVIVLPIFRANVDAMSQIAINRLMLLGLKPCGGKRSGLLSIALQSCSRRLTSSCSLTSDLNKLAGVAGPRILLKY
jgi:hypothetical protein